MREDVRRARAIARAMLAVTLALPVVVLLLTVIGPGGPSPMSLYGPWYVIATPWFGGLLYLVGLGWMIRIYRSRPESSRPSWRHRDRAEVPIPTWSTNGRTPHAPPNQIRSWDESPGVMREDVARAQATARAMIILAIYVLLLVMFQLVAAPGHMGGGLEPPWYSAAAPLVGVALYLVGLGWMIRIYRSRPESDDATWRYRDD
jgi:hypothetical protein